jgi:hypothetical protein
MIRPATAAVVKPHFLNPVATNMPSCAFGMRPMKGTSSGVVWSWADHRRWTDSTSNSAWTQSSSERRKRRVSPPSPTRWPSPPKMPVAEPRATGRTDRVGVSIPR